MDDYDCFVCYLLLFFFFFEFFFTMEYKTCSRLRIVKQFLLAHLVVARIHSHTHTRAIITKEPNETRREKHRAVQLCGFFSFISLSLSLSLSLSYSLVFFSFFFFLASAKNHIQCIVLSIRLLLVVMKRERERKNDQQQKTRRQVSFLNVRLFSLRLRLMSEKYRISFFLRSKFCMFVV